MQQAIVDSHIHFWDPSLMRYDWLSEHPEIEKAFLPRDLADVSSRYRLEKIVFIQAECIAEQAFQEVEFVSSLSREDSRISAIVARVPMESAERTRVMLSHLRDRPLVKGVRRLIQWEPAGFCIQPEFLESTRLLPEYGFTFDICIYESQLTDAVKLVRACPEVQFVLDHLGKPDVKRGSLEPWRSGISRIAEFPNVYCKISGLATEADHQNWTPVQLEPYVDHVIEEFGRDRIMFGADWPVSTLAVRYGEWIDLVDRMTPEFEEQDKNKLFFENARDFYGLG